ncbi:MAG TPA: response regulator [Stellaceae bacterium]|nr:response regulator [Stellaceae bacterium]
MPADNGAKIVAAPAGAPVDADGRSASAHSAWILPASLETTDGRRIDCTLLDVSSRGARLIAWEPLVQGQTVMLRSRDLGDTKARVLWIGADTVALEFMRDDTASAAQMALPRALIVEDDEAMRDLLRRALERAGFAVATAATGRAALKLFGERQVDLAVTDLTMPEMDGLSLIRELIRVQPSARIIVVSGADRGHDTARTLGAKAVLRKPVALSELTRVAQDVLADASVGEPPAPDYVPLRWPGF